MCDTPTPCGHFCALGGVVSGQAVGVQGAAGAVGVLSLGLTALKLLRPA